MKRQLLVIAGPDKGRRFDLPEEGSLAIGRGQASDTRINDPRMSRVHCHVMVDGDDVKLVDAGSTGGTLVGADSITQQNIQPGTVFRIGDTNIRYDVASIQDDATLAGETMLSELRSKKTKIAQLPDLVGHSFGSYRIDSIITESNSGMVFRATDTDHDLAVALKILSPDLAHSEEQKERFVRAMKTMLPIRHDNIVRLYNAGKKGPFCWVAMEYVDGDSMTRVIDRIGVEGMLDWKEAWRAGLHIGRALVEAHGHKVIHRNVTPPNIIRRSSDKVCLLGDLVLAKALEGNQTHQVTRPGQLIGEVAYMSPERTQDGANVDQRSDIYGLGATLYALLTGQPPFQSESLVDMIQLIRKENPKPPQEYQMSIEDRFEDLVLRMLAKDPENRFATSRALVKEFERVGKYHNLKTD